MLDPEPGEVGVRRSGQRGGTVYIFFIQRLEKRRSNDRAAVVRSGEIDQLLWGRKIDNATGAADVIHKRCSWFWCQW